MRTHALFCLAAAALAAANPFENGENWYVNPSYWASLDTSIATAEGEVKTTLQSMRDVPSAWWIDVKAKVYGDNTNTVEGILKDAASKADPPLVTFMVYDVPNRDCHAKASNGEICCTYNADGTCDYDTVSDCADGLLEYQTTYIDPLVDVFSQYQDTVPIVLVIEPDSLPNLATNLDDPRCSNTATQNAYKLGIAYAINEFATKVPKATVYLDAAHGGWLGWEDNMVAFHAILEEMGILPQIRGFATNVANYQPVGEQCPEYDYCTNNMNQDHSCCRDPCDLQTQWNRGHNEANYVLLLQRLFPDKYVIIDTGRNGVDDMRSDCANWCNARGAGIGRVPSTNTGMAMVDAFYWLKTPGESDGCTQILPSGDTCPRFDDFCGSADSLGSMTGEPRAPEAGHWFDYQIKQLAANANLFPDGVTPTPSTSTTPTPSTPMTPTPSTPTTPATPGTCVPKARCLTSASCCGETCFQLVNERTDGMCLSSCSGWVCNVLSAATPVTPATPTPPTPATPTPPTPATPVPATSSCTGGEADWAACTNNPCCASAGYTCYEQSEYYAQCIPTGSCSTGGWTCRVLS